MKSIKASKKRKIELNREYYNSLEKHYGYKSNSLDYLNDVYRNSDLNNQKKLNFSLNNVSNAFTFHPIKSKTNLLNNKKNYIHSFNNSRFTSSDTFKNLFLEKEIKNLNFSETSKEKFELSLKKLICNAFNLNINEQDDIVIAKTKLKIESLLQQNIYYKKKCQIQEKDIEEYLNQQKIEKYNIVMNFRKLKNEKQNLVKQIKNLNNTENEIINHINQELKNKQKNIFNNIKYLKNKFSFSNNSLRTIKNFETPKNLQFQNLFKWKNNPLLWNLKINVKKLITEKKKIEFFLSNLKNNIKLSFDNQSKKKYSFKSNSLSKKNKKLNKSKSVFVKDFIYFNSKDIQIKNLKKEINKLTLELKNSKIEMIEKYIREKNYSSSLKEINKKLENSLKNNGLNFKNDKNTNVTKINKMDTIINLHTEEIFKNIQEIDNNKSKILKIAQKINEKSNLKQNFNNQISKLEKVNDFLVDEIKEKKKLIDVIYTENQNKLKVMKENLYKDYLMSKHNIENEAKESFLLLQKYKSQLNKKNQENLEITRKLQETNSLKDKIRNCYQNLKKVGIYDNLFEEDDCINIDGEEIICNLTNTLNKIKIELQEKEVLFKIIQKKYGKQIFLFNDFIEKLKDSEIMISSLYKKKFDLLKQKEFIELKKNNINILSKTLQENDFKKHQELNNLENELMNIQKNNNDIKEIFINIKKKMEKYKTKILQKIKKLEDKLKSCSKQSLIVEKNKKEFWDLKEVKVIKEACEKSSLIISEITKISNTKSKNNIENKIKEETIYLLNIIKKLEKEKFELLKNKDILNNNIIIFTNKNKNFNKKILILEKDIIDKKQKIDCLELENENLKLQNKKFKFEYNKINYKNQDINLTLEKKQLIINDLKNTVKNLNDKFDEKKIENKVYLLLNEKAKKQNQLLQNNIMEEYYENLKINIEKNLIIENLQYYNSNTLLIKILKTQILNQNKEINQQNENIKYIQKKYISLIKNFHNLNNKNLFLQNQIDSDQLYFNKKNFKQNIQISNINNLKSLLLKIDFIKFTFEKKISKLIERLNVYEKIFKLILLKPLKRIPIFPEVNSWRLILSKFSKNTINPHSPTLYEDFFIFLYNNYTKKCEKYSLEILLLNTKMIKCTEENIYLNNKKMIILDKNKLLKNKYDISKKNYNDLKQAYLKLLRLNKS